MAGGTKEDANTFARVPVTFLSLSSQVHSEAQKLHSIFKFPLSTFNVQTQSHPGADDLRVACSAFSQQKVVVVHMSGHTQDGEMALEARPVATKRRPHLPEAVLNSSFVTWITAGQSVELVFLDACNTVVLGKKLRGEGVPYVVCWQGEVDDQESISFSAAFYQHVIYNATEYGVAFKMACGDMDNTRMRAPSGVAFLANPCLLWADKAGGERGVLDKKWTRDYEWSGAKEWRLGGPCELEEQLREVERRVEAAAGGAARDVSEEAEKEEEERDERVTRNWAPPRRDTDFAKRAGQVYPPPRGVFGLVCTL